MNTKEEAQKLFNWIADTQFNLMYDSDGNLINRNNMTQQIRQRSRTYIDFCFNIEKDHLKAKELIEIKYHLDNCFYY